MWSLRCLCDIQIKMSAKKVGFRAWGSEEKVGLPYAFGYFQHVDVYSLDSRDCHGKAQMEHTWGPRTELLGMPTFRGYIEKSELIRQNRVRNLNLVLSNICCCWVTKSCLTLSNPMDCSPPGPSVHGISQARMLEWVALSFPKGSSWSRDWTQVSCTGRRSLYH